MIFTVEGLVLEGCLNIVLTWNLYRAGLESDYSVVPEIIQNIELGIAVDGFLNEVEIMANNDPAFYYTTLYLNFSLGNKFY